MEPYSFWRGQSYCYCDFQLVLQNVRELFMTKKMEEYNTDAFWFQQDRTTTYMAYNSHVILYLTKNGFCSFDFIAELNCWVFLHLSFKPLFFLMGYHNKASEEILGVQYNILVKVIENFWEWLYIIWSHSQKFSMDYMCIAY